MNQKQTPLPDYPTARLDDRKGIVFLAGTFCALPSEYKDTTSREVLKEFYLSLLKNAKDEEVFSGEDPLGFNYVVKGDVCYVGVLFCDTEKVSSELAQRYSSHIFHSKYLIFRAEEFHKKNAWESLPASVVVENLHEVRGLNARIGAYVEAAMGLYSDEEWDQKFDQSEDVLKRVYVCSRLTKFILDSTNFHVPNFYETLKREKDKIFNVIHSVKKMHKIYAYSPKGQSQHIDLRNLTGKDQVYIKGRAEYFEILLKILLENAIKYSSFIDRHPPKVLVEMNKSQKKVRVSASSYGFLVPEGERERIFRAGFRSSVNKDRVWGTGIGLRNAYHLANYFETKIVLNCLPARKEESISDNGDLGWNTFSFTLSSVSG